ncbi:MAG TPA: ROK family protein [Micromonosporaceae bacterium]|nr:ROK family protein [Micromonosporaceae bacterium]
MTILGIDIGGSGIKGAPVDLTLGQLAQERYRLETPQPADVDAVVQTVTAVADQLAASAGPAERVGITFPGVVVGGVIRTAANLDKSWIGAPAADLFTSALGCPVTVLNDADAAGVAEVAFGAGRNQSGVTVLLTFGTGIGSAVFIDGVLVPNTEFGHLELHGADAELAASDRARETEDLSWRDWAERVQDYLRHVEKLLWPNLFILGGGVSKKTEKFLPYIDVLTPVVPAALQNNAGIIGAAMAAAAARPATPAG